MNDFLLFTDGTWCIETELHLNKNKDNSYIKIHNPFAPMATFDARLFQKSKKPIIHVYDCDISYTSDFHEFSPGATCRLKFTSDTPIAVGTSIDIIETTGMTFYDIRVIEIFFQGGNALYVGYPRHWILTK